MLTVGAARGIGAVQRAGPGTGAGSWPGRDAGRGFEVRPGAAEAQAGTLDHKAPATDFGRSYAGFALAGTLAFGAAARRGAGSRKRWPEAEFIAPRDGDSTTPDISLKIRLDS